MKIQQTPAALYSGGQGCRRSYGQQRLAHFGITMIVMGVCFFFYYMGFFGGVDGPLNPAQLGENLSAAGVSKGHLVLAAAVLELLSLSWNWIFSLASLLLGRRLTCSRTDEQGDICGEPVRRQALPQKKSSKRKQIYVCDHGHRQPNAHFHPLEKGTIGHMLWVISLLFALVVFYGYYS
ncbi:MAG: hypothetical protein P8X90_09320 [Desulfobacterales bacterium]|jgi:hypothetical protein